jgi:hypothetical protein
MPQIGAKLWGTPFYILTRPCKMKAQWLLLLLHYIVSKHNTVIVDTRFNLSTASI